MPTYKWCALTIIIRILFVFGLIMQLTIRIVKFTIRYSPSYQSHASVFDGANGRETYDIGDVTAARRPWQRTPAG